MVVEPLDLGFATISQPPRKVILVDIEQRADSRSDYCEPNRFPLALGLDQEPDWIDKNMRMQRRHEGINLVMRSSPFNLQSSRSVTSTFLADKYPSVSRTDEKKQYNFFEQGTADLMNRGHLSGLCLGLARFPRRQAVRYYKGSQLNPNREIEPILLRNGQAVQVLFRNSL